MEQLRAALQQVGETYGEASNKTNSYKVSLNNAETELLKLDRALKSNQGRPGSSPRRRRIGWRRL